MAASVSFDTTLSSAMLKTRLSILPTISQLFYRPDLTGALLPVLVHFDSAFPPRLAPRTMSRAGLRAAPRDPTSTELGDAEVTPHRLSVCALIHLFASCQVSRPTAGTRDRR
jgi:hypothetical protein